MSTSFKCPNCGGKISDKHYDSVFEWYECPKCENCLTFDELLEGGGNAIASRVEDLVSEEESPTPRKKGGALVAKGKKRRTEIQEDEEAVAEFEAKALVPVKVKDTTHHRDELPTGQVVNIMADEIQFVYRDIGYELDAENARDKALILWRYLHHGKNVAAREQAVEHVLCEAHA